MLITDSIEDKLNIKNLIPVFNRYTTNINKKLNIQLILIKPELTL
jgi:hypothetical protein